MAEEKKTSPKSDKPAKKKSKKNPFKSIASFFKSVKAEGKKVVWAAAADVVKNTIIVLIVVTIVGVAIYGVDTVLTLGMKGIKNLAATETSVSQQADDDAESELEAEDTTAETTTEAKE